MSGYSKTPLFKKLGYKDGIKALLVNAPDDYQKWITPIPDVEFNDHPPYDMVHFFVNRRKELELGIGEIKDEIKPNGMIWISWYKKTSRMPSEITEDTIREVVLPLGLVDVKVCAVTDIWSGLKVVIRKELR